MTPVGLAQLPLAFRLREGPSFANFVEGRNSGARDWAQAAASGQGEQSIYLWGAKGTGKTHLLEAACRLGCERGSEAVLLPLEQWGQLSPGILAGLDQLSLVCVDDLENIAGRPEWEEQLFHLYNRAQESGTRLLMTGARVPAALGLCLSDLRSRVGAALTVRLRPLDDDGRVLALQSRALERGFQLPDDAARYLIRRQPRDMHSLLRLLEDLDAASLAAQRRVTIPFIRSLVEQRSR